MTYELLSFPGDKDLARSAAARWLETLTAAQSQKAPFVVALSGGRIARVFFSAVADAAKGKAQLFRPVHFFWADERCVPPDHPESNYRVAQELLFGALGIPQSQIHRIRGEDSPETAARMAEQELLGVAPNIGGVPVFDLIFLGMGEDGHVASLFPGERTSSAEKEPVYRSVRASKPPPERVTLSYSVIAAAREVWILASGAGKEDALRRSLEPDASTPLGRVIRSRMKTVILSDIRP
jgi:6-phosphogluconolactonase